MFRRLTLAAFALVALASCATPAPPDAPASSAQSAAPAAAKTVAQPDFAALEKAFGARLGVYAIDTGDGREVAYHADDRFAYASTHKVFNAAAILHRGDDLTRTVTIRQSDLVPNSPITEKHIGEQMSLQSVLDAALRYSDNTADNLMFREIGGPAGLAAELRRLGDTVTHVDRIEPALNETSPGDVRDTTTPRVWAKDLRAVALDSGLPADKQAVLTKIMRANTTGAHVIRAGVPADWQVADKTGSADYGTRNDIAVLWPPHRAPIVLTVLSDRPQKDAKTDDKLIAQAAAAVVKALQ
ncbi:MULTISPECIES: class A beta-lactamase [unclassified Amycolatopsis]|uniref:class A beta-lactamase n=1 Tax=unclassified Amycolatopsis TaxID=2618356 RepID=UPI001EE7ED15|nr:class A beta-lactamase [Amycolatopsis sp. Poz14]MCG3755416.1 class A beta-lactamase [Amycolatopsis sp. Poz14]